MSLLAWYPLTKDGNNQGLDGIDLTPIGTIAYTTGKLGNAPTFTQNLDNRFRRPQIKINDNFSFACWFKLDITESTTLQTLLFEGRDVDSDGWGLRINGSDKRLTYCCGSSFYTYTTDLTIGQWYHAAMTVKDGVCTAYFNGTQVYTGTVIILPKLTEWGTYFYVGCLSDIYYPLMGQVQDVRIYDHPLSEKEVKEIAKGLTIHYSLKGTGVNPNLLTSQYDGGYNFYWDYSTVTTSIGVLFWQSTKLSLEKGVKYTASFDAKIDTTDDTLYQGLECDLFPDSLPQRNFQFTKEDGLTNKWKHFTWTTSSTKDDITNCRLRFFIDFRDSVTGNSVNAPIHVKNIKLEKGEVDTAWIPPEGSPQYSIVSPNSIEYDLTGYGNNATKTNITYLPDSPRYNTCVDFVAKSSHIVTDAAIKVPYTEFTIAIWAYLDSDSLSTSSNNTSNIVCLGGNEFARFRVGTENTNIWVYLNNGDPTFNYTFSESLLEKWHHYAITFKGGSACKLYIDGVLCHTQTTTVASITPTSNIWHLGEYVNANTETMDGRLSDFRFYATCLTDEDIKNLYNTSVSIDNLSNLHSKNIEEVGNTSITSSGSRTLNYIETDGTSTYTVNGTLTNNDGVFTGFSGSNYLTTNCTVSANSDNLLLYGSYTTTDNLTSEQYIVCTNNRNLGVRIQNGRFGIQKSSNNGVGWDVIFGTTNVIANTKYYFKIISHNSTLRLYIQNGTGYKEECSITIPQDGTYKESVLGFGVHIPTKVDSTKALGSIDLKDYGVFISGKEVWRGIDTLLGENKAKIGSNYITGNRINEE